MPRTRHTGYFDTRFVRHLWGLTKIYWTSPDAAKGAALLALCVSMELGLVYANVKLAWADSHVFALDLFDLHGLADRLDEIERWDHQLSGDEKQRLTFARALLHAPNWLILDDATAALDDAMEERVYELLTRHLPGATLVSITNRPSVARYHQRQWRLELSDLGAASLQAS